MQHRRLTATLLAALALGSGPANANGETPMTMTEDEMACAGAAFMDLVGQPEAAADAIPEPKRIIPPNSVVTMDFLATRTNVDLDEAGVITRIWCG